MTIACKIRQKLELQTAVKDVGLFSMSLYLVFYLQTSKRHLESAAEAEREEWSVPRENRVCALRPVPLHNSED